MAGKRIEIVSACDERYAPHFAAMLHSAALYHPEARYWLLADRLKPETEARLQDFADSLRLDLRIVADLDRYFAAIVLPKGRRMATYLRLFLHEALPEIGRALYLDADVTVTGDLRPLFDLDLGHFTVACVADAEATAGPERIALKLPANATYHNAGVMLVDLSAWRSQGWPEKMIAYANSGKPLAFHDQTILNAVLAGRILTLPIKWNFTEPDRWRETLPPVIIHYAGWKPWEDPVVPYRDLYRLHRMQTPFPYDERYSRNHDRKWLRRRILAALGIPAYRRRLDLLGRNAQIRQAITVPAVADAQRRMALRDANGVQIVERSSDREEYPT